MELYKAPGVSETLDWVAALTTLGKDTLDADAFDHTLGVVLKAKEDLESLRAQGLTVLLERARTRAAQQD